MFLTVVIPAYNEEKNITHTIKDLEDKLKIKHKLIVVIDHCTDGTLDKVMSLKPLYPRLEIVHNHKKQGIGNALKTGFQTVKKGVVVPIMADLCDDPYTITEMHEKIQQGFDIVCGSRYMKGGKKISCFSLQSFFSNFVGISFHYLTGISTFDVSNAFKMYRCEVLKEIHSVEESFAIAMEITTKAYFAGFKIIEIPTIWRERTAGKSSFVLFKVAPGYMRWYIWGILKKLKLIIVGSPGQVEENI